MEQLINLTLQETHMKKLFASLAGLALCASVGVANAESSQPTTLSAAQLDGVTGAGGNTHRDHGRKHHRCGCDGDKSVKNENETNQKNYQNNYAVASGNQTQANVNYGGYQKNGGQSFSQGGDQYNSNKTFQIGGII
jgi:hypothetical protein